jgi:hypothetical protein
LDRDPGIYDLTVMNAERREGRRVRDRSGPKSLIAGLCT